MRISDLSSDVCSSDLEAAISIAEQRLAAAQRVATETNRRVVRALDPLFAAERAKTTVAQARIALDQARENAARKSGVLGKSVSVRIDIGCPRIIQNTYSKAIKHT